MLSKAEKGDLRSLLSQKLGVTERRVYQMAQELGNRASIRTEEAIWVLASQNKINLTKYLPPEVVDRVRLLLTQIPAPPRTVIPSHPAKVQRVKPRTRPSDRILTLPSELLTTDPILSDQTRVEAREMAEIYPLIYRVENSVRELIRRVIEARHSKAWWDTEAPRACREKIQERMANDKKNAWHQRRGSHPIDYLDLNQLPALVRKEHTDFVPNLLSSLEWFEQFIDEIYLSRCVICHMNPLDRDNIQAVKLRYRQWAKLLNEKKSQIP